MTATLPHRVPAGLPGGGQFAPKACAGAYAVLDALARQATEELETAVEVVRIGEAGRVSYDAGACRYRWTVPRCPHGHFPHWAATHCCKPRTTRRTPS